MTNDERLRDKGSDWFADTTSSGAPAAPAIKARAAEWKDLLRLGACLEEAPINRLLKI